MSPPLNDPKIYRILNTFKDPGSIDVKGLAKEYGKSFQFWGGKKGAMMSFDKAYSALLKAGFSPREISHWVKRPTHVPEVPIGEGKTPNAEGGTLKTPRESYPRSRFSVAQRMRVHSTAMLFQGTAQLLQACLLIPQAPAGYLKAIAMLS